MKTLQVSESQSVQPQAGCSVIEGLAEGALVSSSVAVVKVASTVAEPVVAITPKISSPSTSEPPSFTTVTTPEAPITTVTELLLLQLWELCGYSQLPAATILPVAL